jgi:hypothetical protein
MTLGVGLELGVLQKTELRGVRDRRGSGGNVQFGQGIGDVPVDGVLADAQAIGDGLITQTAGNQRKTSSSRAVRPLVSRADSGGWR